MTSTSKTENHIPLWLKLAYTAMFAVVAYVNMFIYHWSNMLWFSHTALILVLVAVWTKKRLLTGMAGISVLVFHTLWTVVFFLRLFTGLKIGALDYMFDPATSIFLRSISMFHAVLPVFILWLIKKKGYDTRALKYQVLWGGFILLSTFALTTPDQNINKVYGLVTAQQSINPYLYLGLIMVGLAVLIYTPTHLFLRYFAGES